MTVLLEKLEELKVIKRNGKKVDFSGTKVAVTIKKGFDSITIDEDLKYSEKDIQIVYQAVIKRIIKEFKNADKIKIEEIQDLIEAELKNNGYEDVFQSFSEFRERRSQSRALSVKENRLQKFIKTIECLGLKSSHEEDA